MSMTSRVNIDLDHVHCRAICDEIGDRLRMILRRSASELPPRLNDLMARLAEADREPSPSIVPSFADMMAGRETIAPASMTGFLYADLAVDQQPVKRGSGPSCSCFK
jgi:hypothetical protein